MKRSLLVLAVLALGSFGALPAAHAFCGFYVGKAGAELYNHGSKVVIARDGNRTVLTMANDFEGDLKEFALVVPVPSVLQKEQIHVGEKALIDRIDSYSAPRLVEYTDPDPCAPIARYNRSMAPMAAGMAAKEARDDREERASALGVKVEASYTVGEYDIAVLSAKQSDGLETYLHEQGYALPPRAAAALAPYIKQDMKFFVAKVNLKEQAATGVKVLRPLQMAFESEKFMLPIRLGMANARGAQDLVVYTLTRNGRVESSNYKTVNVPSEVEVPSYVRSEFGKFYGATFARAHAKADYRAVFTEYVWNASGCDPCVESPLTATELRGLGVFWLDASQEQSYHGYSAGGSTVVTRLHVRYDNEHFPEDLVFQQTGDQSSFQARYILRNEFKGNLACDAGRSYQKQLHARHAQQAQTLASLTGWDKSRIAVRMGPEAADEPAQEKWYQQLWK
jgi:hypothetical protein